jgi:hypothetical protein
MTAWSLDHNCKAKSITADDEKKGIRLSTRSWQPAAEAKKALSARSIVYLTPQTSMQPSRAMWLVTRQSHEIIKSTLSTKELKDNM